MATLPAHATVQDLQRYVRQMTQERGFSSNSVLQECLLLTEEVGELSKAVRKQEQLRVDEHSKVGTIAEELADILIVLTAIANHYEVDLERAFRDKEAVNDQRTWRPAA
ncbi:MAG TPA: MazG nucleotide pyrophosphohydrolase domain-containing protein [Candidatus Saccharimonadia bacterium]|nr:MazG nucleotide pyrophosphohydrolase domain-containing protein [Candidatus Saccharimonadia bacterium]